MTPLDLFSRLREILAEECGCNACWGEHLHPLSPDELTAIRSRILQVLSERSRQVVSNLNRVWLKSA